jgi:phosphopantothenoylcysteine decarboxylase/phosphopantothenate--cysteine ligase
MRKPKLIVTAGPTREHIDPVRFISNPSTGKMGFAVARSAARRGFETVLVAGPVTLSTPAGVRRVDVVSARQMLEAVVRELESGTPAVLVATAAVADWRPEVCAASKLKKRDMKPVIRLKRNPDILKLMRRMRSRADGLRLVGFAAETENLEANALDKLQRKNLDWIIANLVSDGFGNDTNKVIIFNRDGKRFPLDLEEKGTLAQKIVDLILPTM